MVHSGSMRHTRACSSPLSLCGKRSDRPQEREAGLLELQSKLERLRGELEAQRGAAELELAKRAMGLEVREQEAAGQARALERRAAELAAAEARAAKVYVRVRLHARAPVRALAQGLRV